MVIIGHASMDERGKISGGKSGDQTGREVCSRAWYKNGWKILLRPLSSEIAERSAVACERGCANPNIGYDQKQRNTAYLQAQKTNYDLSKITTPCETDCSAFMTLCAIAAGVKSLEYVGNAPTTTTMRNKFVSSGYYKALTEDKYLNSSNYLKRGDILVNPGRHTVMVLNDGDRADVRGNVSITTFTILKRGSSGDNVKRLQIALNDAGARIKIDGKFGKETFEAVCAFQRAYQLGVDGEAGPITLAALGLL